MFFSSFDVSNANDFGGESNGSGERLNPHFEVGNRRAEEPRCIRRLQEEEEEQQQSIYATREYINVFWRLCFCSIIICIKWRRRTKK